jgi:predicted nuclease with RNAse H fold
MIVAETLGAADSGPVRALGIDLRSGPRYPTGVALLDSRLRARWLATARTDAELLSAVERFQPAIVAIDAPLGLPEGRCCAEVTCECARFGIMREVDRACSAAGYRPFPSLLPSMVGLTLRGIELHAALEAAGQRVIEVYPGMAQDILGVPRKRQGRAALAAGLRRVGVRAIPRHLPSHDVLDAITCALVGILHLGGATETMGPGVPVPLVLPKRGDANTGRYNP